MSNRGYGKKIYDTLPLNSYLVGRDDKPDEVFQGEPANEDGFSDTEKVVFLVVVSVARLFLSQSQLLIRNMNGETDCDGWTYFNLGELNYLGETGWQHLQNVTGRFINVCNYSFYRGGGHFSNQYFMCIKLPQICQQESPGRFSQKLERHFNFSISLVGVSWLQNLLTYCWSCTNGLFECFPNAKVESHVFAKILLVVWKLMPHGFFWMLLFNYICSTD